MMSAHRGAFIYCIGLILIHYFSPSIASCPFSQFQNVYQGSSSGVVAFATVQGQSNSNTFKPYLGAEKSSKNDKCPTAPANCSSDTNNLYVRSYDGSCNNLIYPSWGMSKTRYTRLLPPKYSDDSYSPPLSIIGTPLPNARLLSLSLYGEESKPDNFRTLATMQWSQIVAHDISELTRSEAPKDCCTGSYNKYCYPISLPPYDPITYGSGKTCLSFSRSASDLDISCMSNEYSHAEKISSVNAYLDLSFLYGNTVEQNAKVRQYSGGLLKTSIIENRHWPPISINVDGECGENNYQCYNLPDRRNQFIPSIIVLHIILLREHNRIANIIAQLNPQYNDEQIFQIARKINVAQYQKITFYDWLPLIIGPSYAYANDLIYYIQNGEYVNDYDPSVNAAPFAEYSAAAFRYAHTQIPGWFSLVAPYRNSNVTMRLSDYFEKPENINFIAHCDNFDALLRGMATQLQKDSDSNIDKEIKHHFNRKPFEEYGSDLKAMDIQRARDYGLRSYNDYRQLCGLPRAYDWSGFLREISADKVIQMQRLYASPDDVDLAIGGSLEAHAPESILGPTFQCIVGRQLRNTRVGDRFFYENENVYSGFTKAQLVEIRKSSISGLLCNNGDYLRYIQPNAFIFLNTQNVLKNCDVIPQMDLTKWTAV